MKSNKHNTSPVLAVVTAAALLGAAALAPEGAVETKSQADASQRALMQDEMPSLEQDIKEKPVIKKPVLAGELVITDGAGHELGSGFNPLFLAPGKDLLRVTPDNINDSLQGALLGVLTKDSTGTMRAMVIHFNQKFARFTPADEKYLEPVTVDLQSLKIGDSVNPQYILTPVEGTYPSDITFPSGTVGQYIEAPGQETAGKTLSF